MFWVRYFCIFETRPSVFFNLPGLSPFCLSRLRTFRLTIQKSACHNVCVTRDAHEHWNVVSLNFGTAHMLAAFLLGSFDTANKFTTFASDRDLTFTFTSILQVCGDEPDIPLSETQATKSPWEEPQLNDEKDECPKCFEPRMTKIRSYYTSLKSYLAKNDLSFFIEMSSRIVFPLMYIGFIAYFFGKYGIWRFNLLPLHVSKEEWKAKFK